MICRSYWKLWKKRYSSVYKIVLQIILKCFWVKDYSNIIIRNNGAKKINLIIIQIHPFEFFYTLFLCCLSKLLYTLYNCGGKATDEMSLLIIKRLYQIRKLPHISQHYFHHFSYYQLFKILTFISKLAFIIRNDKLY